MTVQILDYKASVPNNSIGGTIAVPTAPSSVQLADLGLFLVPPAPASNRVELKATVGLFVTSGAVAQVVLRIFRDGNLIFTTQQGLDTNEDLYTVTFQAIDFNVASGFHVYTLTAELLAGVAVVDGPVVFSGLALGPIA